MAQDATANQQARVKAGRFDREFRVKIGPPREYVTAALFTAGEAITLPTDTTTTAAISATDDSISVSSTTNFLTADYLGTEGGDDLTTEGGDILLLEAKGAGGTVLVTDGTDYGWVQYTGADSTTLDELTWLAGANAFSGTGHTVSQWYDITDRVYQNSITISEEEDFPLYDWSVEMRGDRYHSDLMLPDATIVIEQRLTPNGSFGTYTDWLVACVGYVCEWRTIGDYRGRTQWNATIESVRTYVDQHRVETRQYGDTNIAAGKTVTTGYSDGSSPDNLGSPALEPAEFTSGFSDIDGSNLTDETITTRWISSNIPTLGPIDEAQSGSIDQIIIDEVMVNGPTGTTLQYVVIRVPPYSVYYNDSGIRNLDTYVLTTDSSVFDSPSGGDPPNMNDDYVRLPRITLNKDQPALILTNNRSNFESVFGVSSAFPVADWRFQPSVGAGRPSDGLPGETFSLADDDVLHLRYCGCVSGLSPDIIDMVAWGDDSNYDFFQSNDDTSNWNDPSTVTLGAAGTSIKRSPRSTDTNTAGDWAIETTPAPGDEGGGDFSFVSIDLGEIGAELNETMTATYPPNGSQILISSANDLDRTGTIQIDSEQISYTDSKHDRILNITRAANSTTAAAHTKGSDVYAVHDFGAGDTAHRMFNVEQVELLRDYVPNTAGAGLPIVPYRIELWGSRESSPRYPGTANYRTDWDDENKLSYYNNRNQTHFGMSFVSRAWDRHYQHVMVVIRQMSDLGRAKLNEVRIYPKAPNTFVNQTDSDYEGTGAIINDLLLGVLDSSEIDITEGIFAGTSPNKTIPEGTLGNILTDLLEETMTTLRYTLDGSVEVRKHPVHPTANRPDVTLIFDAAMVRSPRRVQRPSRLGVGQIIVNVEHPRTGEVITAKYPPTEGPGEIAQYDVRMELNQNDIAGVAQALYLAHPDISKTYDFKTSGPAEFLQSGQRVLIPLSSVIDGDFGPVGLVNCRITSVTHNTNGVEELSVQEWRIP